MRYALCLMLLGCASAVPGNDATSTCQDTMHEEVVGVSSSADVMDYEETRMIDGCAQTILTHYVLEVSGGSVGAADPFHCDAAVCSDPLLRRVEYSDPELHTASAK